MADSGIIILVLICCCCCLFMIGGGLGAYFYLNNDPQPTVTGTPTTNLSYKQGSGIENVNWKYTNDKDDPACLRNWNYIDTNGNIIKANIASITKKNSVNTWCAINPPNTTTPTTTLTTTTTPITTTTIPTTTPTLYQVSEEDYLKYSFKFWGDKYKKNKDGFYYVNKDDYLFILQYKLSSTK